MRGWAVGMHATAAAAAAATVGRLLHTRDGGASWTTQTFAAPAVSLFGVAFASASTGEYTAPGADRRTPWGSWRHRMVIIDEISAKFGISVSGGAMPSAALSLSPLMPLPPESDQRTAKTL